MNEVKKCVRNQLEGGKSQQQIFPLKIISQYKLQAITEGCNKPGQGCIMFGLNEKSRNHGWKNRIQMTLESGRQGQK